MGQFAAVHSARPRRGLRLKMEFGPYLPRHATGMSVARYSSDASVTKKLQTTKEDFRMKKTHGTVLSRLVLSGAVLVMAPHAWGQTGGSSGAASPRGSETQKSGDASGTSSSQRSGSSSGMSSSSEQGQSGTSARRMSGQRISKDQVKQVQSALKSKGM